MSLMQRGFTRLYANGQTIDLSSPDDYPRDDFDDVYVLVDRLTARPDVRQRLVDSLEICFQEGQGRTIIETADANPQRLPFSDRFECKYDATVYAIPERGREVCTSSSPSNRRTHAHRQSRRVPR